MAYPPKDYDASVSTSISALEPVGHYAEEDADARGVPPPSGVYVVDIDDDSRHFM